MLLRQHGLSGVLIGLLVVSVVGCGSGESTKTTPKPVVTSSENAKASAPQPGEPAPDNGSSKLMADWPTPAAALLVSGEQNGYLEPCGCTSGQLGGLKRRHELCERLKSQGWNLVPIDLGGLIKDPGASLGGLEQTKIKFTVAMRALKMMNYQAVALSAADLKLGTLEVLGQYLNLGDSPKILAANVKPTAGFEQTIIPSMIAKAGEKKIGITAVIDPASLEKNNDPTLKDLLTISTPKDSLNSVSAELSNQSDWQVLMVQGPAEMAKSLAEAFPAFDVVVAASVFEDPTAEAEKANGGKTLIVNVGKKGKYNGIVGFFPGTDQPVRYQRVTLGSRYDRPGAGEPIRKLIDEDFQHELKAAKVVENFPRRSPLSAAPGAQFVGAGACKTCHPATYAKWLTSKHSHGYEPLTNPKRNREFDAECITCHTTGFEYETGWVSIEKTPYLKGNQCENCHGPGSLHSADPDNAVFKKALALKADQADKNMLCIRCHDADNSPHFAFATAWPQVMHTKMDNYDNPKVHKGLKTEEIARLQKALLADQQPKDTGVQKANY